MEKYRLKLALLIAIFISLITSGGRRYWDADDMLFLPEIVVLFATGFLVSIASWMVIFKTFHFKRPYRKWRIFYAVGQFLLITISMAAMYIAVLSCFKSVIIENVKKFHDLGTLVNWGFGRCLPMNVFILIIKFSTDENEMKQEALLRNEILISESIIAKYDALKQQINPHFLFNSMNTLKSLIKLDTDRSVDFVIRLSDVYRYLLKHGENGTVKLREELAFLHAYNYLLERRYEKSLIVDIDVPEYHLDSLLPPVSLQILIENAVKHNIVSSARPLRVQIGIENENILVQNNLQPRYSVELSEGIGLGNIDRRYQLLIDKGIVIDKDDKNFKVYLPLIPAP